jgi:hypothetical protein
MKYLKSINEARHVKTIGKQFTKEYDKINSNLDAASDYIKDITVYLSDDGYEVETNVCKDITDNHVSIKITNKRLFELEEIKDVLIHLDRYLKSIKIESHLPYLINSDKYKSRLTKLTHFNSPPTYYFFCRFYPKKVKDIRDKIDSIRNQEG